MKISRIATAFLAVALMAFLATDVMAQRGGGREGGGGPGGGRGPGGGPGGRGGPGGFGGGPISVAQMSIGFLRVEEVRAEIELMPDQEEALQKIGSERPEREDFNWNSASEKEREEFLARRQKQREDMVAKQQEQLEEILLPDQYDRLREVAIQALDVEVLRDEAIAKDLKITDAQKKDMEEVREKNRTGMREQMQALFQGGNREGMREKMAEIRETNNKKVLDVLTSDQKSDFAKMKGEKFEMPEGGLMRAMFAGRGGPGGGRGGPGGGRGFGRGGEGGDGGGRGGRGGERRRPEIEE